MPKFERKFYTGLDLIFAVIGVGLLILVFLQLISFGRYFWNNLLSIFTWNVIFYSGVYWLSYSLLLRTFGQKAENNYQQIHNKDECDFCKKKVEKIELRNYFYGKTVLCKNCHKKHLIIQLEFHESITLMFFLIFLFTIPVFADSKYILLGFFTYLLLIFWFLLIIFYRLKRY